MAGKKCILVDGNSLLYRAFFAIRYLSTRDGLPTNALYGFAGMLLKLLAEEEPDCVIVAFDAPEKTFRHEEYSDYKATRAPTPDELKQQAPLARELARALGFQVLEIPGYEADDIVGTCARLAERQGYDVLVVTGDLDELQLVSDRVKVAVTGRGVSDITIYDPQAVRERFGLSPEQFVDYKALKGDTTDNIPGVPGVGDKTASKLVAQFGGLDGLLARLDEVQPERLREAIRDSRQQLEASRRLCRIVTDVPLEVDFASA
ncbi:MAG: 5'-3' exonuclease H3TH domain-containing protein, partial [Armatimonadota bacterium]